MEPHIQVHSAFSPSHVRNIHFEKDVVIAEQSTGFEGDGLETRRCHSAGNKDREGASD